MKNTFIVFILICIGIVGYITLSKKVSYTPAGNGKSTQISVKTYNDETRKIAFQYPFSWHIFDKNNALVLLKQETYPEIASENYALGDQISIWTGPLWDFHNKPTTVEKYIENELEENMFSGKPTKHTSFTKDGYEVHIIEHRNPSIEQTLDYIFFKGDRVYRFYLFPYEPNSQNEKDFQIIVNSWKSI